ncbi:fructose-bisphosphatase class II, partial [Klebsiella aerogenes]
MGIEDPRRKYELTDLARGDVIVAATGVTDGALLRGVRFKPGFIETETLIYRSSTGTVRRITGEHRRPERFEG